MERQDEGVRKRRMGGREEGGKRQEGERTEGKRKEASRVSVPWLPGCAGEPPGGARAARAALKRHFPSSPPPGSEVP